MKFAARIATLCAIGSTLAAVLGFIAARVRLPVAVSIPIVIAIIVILSIAIAHGVSSRVTRTLDVMTMGVRGFRENDFSTRLVAKGNDEIADLVKLYNEVAADLRIKRSEIYQRELLLETILQGSPIAVVLTNPADRIVFSNHAARETLAEGKRIDGKRFAEVVATLPEAMREQLGASSPSLFTIQNGDRDEIFRFVPRQFHVNTQRHTLIMLERLTPELRRQELEVWKRAIRTINHELNNSIAPISSLFHSARQVQNRPEHAHRLDEIYDTIEERLSYLRDFLVGYAQFARLPPPRKDAFDWRAILNDVNALYPFRLEGKPGEGFGDRAQLQQVLINLVKNAHESGSAVSEIVVEIDRSSIRVLDRGSGMNDETLRRALLPFQSTKEGGTGVGLALSNEIIEAHGGRLSLQRREGGGTVVQIWLP